jgi:hypothetical protein
MGRGTQVNVGNAEIKRVEFADIDCMNIVISVEKGFISFWDFPIVILP